MRPVIHVSGLYTRACSYWSSGSVSARTIVRSFLGDGDVVRVTLLQAGGGHLHELGVGAELINRTGSGVAHRGPESADELIDQLRDGALVGLSLIHISEPTRPY